MLKILYSLYFSALGSFVALVEDLHPFQSCTFWVERSHLLASIFIFSQLHVFLPRNLFFLSTCNLWWNEAFLPFTHKQEVILHFTLFYPSSIDWSCFQSLIKYSSLLLTSLYIFCEYSSTKFSWSDSSDNVLLFLISSYLPSSFLHSWSDWSPKIFSH